MISTVTGIFNKFTSSYLKRKVRLFSVIDSINRPGSGINHFKYQVFVLMKEFQKSVITGNANYKIIKPSFMSENIISHIKKFN